MRVIILNRGTKEAINAELYYYEGKPVNLLPAYPYYDEFWRIEFQHEEEGIFTIQRANRWNCGPGITRLQSITTKCLKHLFSRKYKKQGSFVARIKEDYESIFGDS